MLGRLMFASVILFCHVIPNISEKTVFTIYETVENINAQGYQAERHQTITDDGYILEMHRIPHKRGSTESPTDRPVVFLMHGLLAASNSFIVLGANYSIAYNLADAGFDVWLGNARGNKNSRYHATLNPDDPNQRMDFFDFTFEEIGMYDVAVMVDYVLEQTGKTDLHFIGHSQGGTAFLVLNSMRTEYNAKFKSAHLLAGVGYMEFFPNAELAQAARYTDIIYNMALSTGFVELYPPNSEEGDTGDITDMCAGDSSLDFLCDLMGVGEISGDDSDENNIVAGASMKQIAHFGQNVRDAKFRRWSFGFLQNLFIYGSFTAPDYDLSLINVNVTMHYTVNDNLLDERDVFSMVNDMPNARARKVARETFLHEDFAMAEDAKELVTDYIIDAIRSYHYFSVDNDELIEDTDNVADEILEVDNDNDENNNEDDNNNNNEDDENNNEDDNNNNEDDYNNNEDDDDNKDDNDELVEDTESIADEILENSSSFATKSSKNLVLGLILVNCYLLFK